MMAIAGPIVSPAKKSAEVSRLRRFILSR